MKIDVLDIKGKKVDEITLKKEIFGIEPNETVLAQYVRVYRTNQRQGTSSTLNRGEVSGGGKKPWKQKGTGRARVGSTRNPIWVHGGVAHGPKPKDWTLKLPKKVKRLALISALSSAVEKKKLTVLDKIEIESPKSKLVCEIVKNLDLKGSTLIVLNEKNDNLLLGSRNILGLNPTLLNNLNAYDILNARNVVFMKDAILGVQKKYENK
ncbi:MAG: ribosomal protein L4/L1e, large subunit ribosomal protein L4 [candidate division WWE3 bacterium GW2011_GWC1_41_7]|uniref:Large ribosomal subunit protein uL4 n=2 Tax=Katanobacteria TaxID=422282 RepID=A0A0G0XCZ6_UNCKA|nr:MAG: ribosomal protein L4/L1e, large subunit ribosomal protein L4 [candidate division WWE3 bacterium GW2011_GWC1_41_7]KKS22257.1 MAG: 50S ribosomal protein L4 [candidate division WWE3 bacterium GW2011_GWA1_41_8]